MRLRKIPNALEILQEHPDYVIITPQNYKGKWHSFFGNMNPIHLEVGMGKGQFIITMAKNHPDINFIGIEVVESIMVKALRKYKREEEKLPNLIFVLLNAQELENVFEKGEVSQIYLNFSDPWPKKRHEKRRLTYSSFLQIFKNILKDDGEIHLKTDNEKFFEYSLVSMSQFGMVFNFVSLDLHKSDFQGNVMTEYEERFSQTGQRIFRLEAKFKKV